MKRLKNLDSKTISWQILNKFPPRSRLNKIVVTTKKSYPSDLSNAKWQVLKLLLMEYFTFKRQVTLVNVTS